MSENSIRIGDITFTQYDIPTFIEGPELNLFYYNYLDSAPFYVKGEYEGFKEYRELLKDTGYTVILAYDNQEFSKRRGGVICTYDKFTNHILIRQFISFHKDIRITDFVKVIRQFSKMEGKNINNVVKYTLSDLVSVDGL